MNFQDLSSFSSEDQAKNWVLDLVKETTVARMLCNVFIPDPNELLVQTQQKNYNRFMLLHGCCLGALLSLFKCDKISEVCYTELHSEIMNTLIPTVVG